MLSNYLQQGIFLEIEKGLANDAEFYDYVRANSAETPSDKQIQDALNSFLVDLPVYKLQMLLDLRKRFKVYLLSNTNHVMMPYIKATYFTRQGLRFEDYFDHAFLSYEMKMIKPDDEIFLKVLDDAGIKAEESLFIDDGPANVATADRLGFQTYQAKDLEDFRHIFEEL